MLYSLEGSVSLSNDEGIALDVGGIGFFVLCSKKVLREAEPGCSLKILTSLQVSEAGPSLFGFNDDDERTLFHILLKVRGVGSRLAISILRVLDFSDIINSIASGSSLVLCQVPGVGKKTAERLCFELKQQIDRSGLKTLASMVSPEVGDTVQFVYDALESLGFSRSESRTALARILARKEPESPEQLLRDALTEMKKN
jgi:Holliday junction DNA helicase RuvA